MSYVSNTDADRAEMFEAIGIERFEDLIGPIPEPLRFSGDLDLPPALSELQVVRHLQELASQNLDLESNLSFLGAGIYDHFRPSVVAAMMSRGEFATAYTPYQPELSQGMLQTIYEYQTMICALTGMDISNASMYDAATGLAEAALMATHALNRSEVVVSSGVHPNYREVLATYLRWTGFTLVEAPLREGITGKGTLSELVSERTAAVIYQQPNFFGVIEDPADIVEEAHTAGALAIACADPISLGLLKPPGEYGVDVVVGEGQGLGNPMGYGGPLLGYFACKKQYLRAFPGRIVGATIDEQGRRGYTMTLRTREQDIRRDKATSNICTNQALIALCATVYLTELGKSGMQHVANLCLQKAHYCMDAMCSIPGIRPTFPGRQFFKEFALQLPVPAIEFNAGLLSKRIVGGLPLSEFYPDLPNTLLLAVTETKTREDIDRFVQAAAEVVS